MAGKPPAGDVSGWRALALVGQLGLVMALSVTGGLLAGLVLGRWVGGGGVWVAMGVVFGLAAGAWGVCRLLMKEISWKP